MVVKPPGVGPERRGNPPRRDIVARHWYDRGFIPDVLASRNEYEIDIFMPTEVDKCFTPTLPDLGCSEYEHDGRLEPAHHRGLGTRCVHRVHVAALLKHADAARETL